MVDIIQEGDPRLRTLAEEVPLDQIQSPLIQNIISDMTQALESQDDGVAIAAPQIGITKRIFVVSGRIFDEDFLDEDADPKDRKNPHLVFINPVITKRSKKTQLKTGEGCLSVRWLYGDVKRATNITVTAYDEKGVQFTRGTGGLLAHIVQHEVDHLDGILFIDRAENIRDIPPEENH